MGEQIKLWPKVEGGTHSIGKSANLTGNRTQSSFGHPDMTQLLVECQIWPYLRKKPTNISVKLIVSRTENSISLFYRSSKYLSSRNTIRIIVIRVNASGFSEYHNELDIRQVTSCAKESARHMPNGRFPDRLYTGSKLGARPVGRQQNINEFLIRQHGNYTTRSTIICLMLAIALAGFRPLGQVLVQFMIVWQRYSLNGSSNWSSRSPVASSRLSISQR